MFFATSDDEPAFFVSAVDADDLRSAVTVALEDLYLTLHYLEVKAIPLDGGDDGEKPWAIVPSSVLAHLANHQPVQG